MSLARQITRGKTPATSPTVKKASPSGPDLADAVTLFEAAVLEHLDAVPKAERLETARAILRALNTLKVRAYRNRKKAKP